jgi:hypothetical protein
MYCPICFCLIKNAYDHQPFCPHCPKKTDLPKEIEELFGTLKK